MHISREMRQWEIVAAVVFAASVLCSVQAQPTTTLTIGTIGSLAPPGKAEAADSTLKEFVKTESQLTADLIKQKTWQELADKLANKSVQVGIFQGFEFAWAQQRRPSIKPIALAIHGPRYPVIYVVTAKTDAAKDFAGLRGRAISVSSDHNYLKQYVEEQAMKAGQPADTYFSKIKELEYSEESLDDAVDGVVAAAVVDRAALDMFKRRKAARFAMLRELMHTEPILPPVIAYADGSLDEATNRKFRDGLISANKKDRGQSLLSAFKLAGFEAPASDFDAMAKSTLRVFPMPKAER